MAAIVRSSGWGGKGRDAVFTASVRAVKFPNCGSNCPHPPPLEVPLDDLRLTPFLGQPRLTVIPRATRAAGTPAPAAADSAGSLLPPPAAGAVR